MFKYTTYTLKKVENIFEELEYTIRYAKGNFKAGYCIVETKNVIVINKFFDTEARINSLLDVLANVEVDEKKLTEKPLEFYKKLKKKVLDERRERRDESEETTGEKRDERQETRGEEGQETGDERAENEEESSAISTESSNEASVE